MKFVLSLRHLRKNIRSKWGDSIPAGGEEVSEDRQSDGEEVQEEQTASIESVETESISEVVQDAVEEQPAPELSVEKDTLLSRNLFQNLKRWWKPLKSLNRFRK